MLSCRPGILYRENTSMTSHLDFHQNSFRKSLLNLKEKEVMTDVSLILPDHSTIPCHKVVLMAASPFFETMFQSGLKEDAEQTEKGIQLDFADADIIRMMIEFFYTGELQVTEDNVKGLVAASDFLCCNHVKAHCAVFLENRVGFSNCVDFYKFSKMFNLGVLLVATFEFLLGHFKEFMDIADFETLTEDELAEVVSNDELKCENEDHVFEAIVHWVNADLDVRKEVFPRIALLIRFPFCTSSTLNFHVLRNVLMINSGCMELALEALNSQYHCSHTVIHNARCVPRDAFKGKKQRLVRLCFLDNSTRVDYADRINGSFVKWENVGNKLPRALLVRSVISPRGIYFGERDGKCNFFSTETTEVTESHWQPSTGISAFIDGRMFAFGGYSKCTKSVNSINVREANPEWKPEQEMLLALSWPCIVHFANKVYVFSGQTQDRTHSKVTQEFDPARGKWRLRCEMPGPCENTVVSALNDEIFVFGGKNRVAYSYDPVADEWKVLSRPTKVFDTFITTTTWYGKILFGDKDHMEQYDPVTDTWSPCYQLTKSKPWDLNHFKLLTLCF